MATIGESDTAATADRSWRVFPAGSNGEYGLPRDLVTVIDSGRGCRIRDLDGREFLDFTMGWGSVLLGHAHERISAAVVRQLAHGSNFAHVTSRSLELAERLVAVSAACEQVRFCASGTEATLQCVRLARGARRRGGVLKFEGAYHGQHDLGTTSLFGRELRPWPKPEPLGTGIPAAESSHVFVAPFNDAAVATDLIARHADELAAVIVEPLHRCLPPVPGFLEAVRAACTAHGVILIFDEVVTGFRLAVGGAQERYGVVPDLVAYGKALGGGHPLGAYGGRRELMEIVREERLGGDDYVWTASTLGGNPVSCAAALAFLDEIEAPGFHRRLDHLGACLRHGMEEALADAGLEATVIGDGPLAQVVFRRGPVTSSREIWQSAPGLGRRLMLGLFARGVFLNPMGTKLYLSAAHDEPVIADFLGRFRSALVDLVT